MTELEKFRSEKDDFFRSDSQSPLSAEQRKVFRGLNYFPENGALRFHATLDRDVAHETVEMDTTGGEKQVYRREGNVSFPLDGGEVTVSLYSTEDSDLLFLPFKDQTSGKETYGAGRYIEVEVAEDDTVLLDFNYAYNPYCSYNDCWSCTIPPLENWLKAPIHAGEMAFEDNH